MQNLLFNLHNHSHYCDGSSPPEEYINAAIKKGFHTLGFSSHAPVPFENKFAIQDESALLQYANEIAQLKEKYKKEIHIFLSLEIDYIPAITQEFSYFKNLINLDYVIGGVHLVRNPHADGLWFIDGPKQETYDEGLHLLFKNDIKKGVIAYWEQMRDMIEAQNPDIVAHLDKIKMHNKNRFFTEKEAWYEDQLDQTLELISRKNTIVEVNTRGVYKGRSNELFPGLMALKKIRALGIPITLNSDAHKPEELSAYFDEAKEILRKNGFEYLKLFTSTGWKDVAI
ncbi:MAG: histidinol-phosphatase [Bacteroidales bacterium]|nr:histidinol-phosphatase [Bacteroidales bacterium]